MSAQTILVMASALGAALIGGTFFAFSNFVMKALGRLSPAEGIAAMQSINVVVINPIFLGTFIGTAVVSLVIATQAIVQLTMPASPYVLAGALLYVGGTFLLTLFGNVPLNDKLAAIGANDIDAIPLWDHYLKRWTRLNTMRTVAAASATLLFVLGLMQSPAGG